MERMKTMSSRLTVLFLMAMVLLTGCPPEELYREGVYFYPRDMHPYEFDGQPELEAPDRLIFRNVAAGEQGVQMAELQNVGRKSLTLLDFVLEGPFELAFPEYLDSPPRKLSPGQSLWVQVTYLAPDEEPRQGRLTVVSDDPTKEEHEVLLLANVDLPCLTIQPATRLRFGAVMRGETARRSIRLTNCSESMPTTVRLADLEADGAFGLVSASDRAGEARVLMPGTSQLVELEFTPQEVRMFEGGVTVLSDDPDREEERVRLSGEGVPPGCPQAVIVAQSEEDSAVAAPLGTLQGKPLEEVVFDGSQSQAFDGASIAEYEWALVYRPADTVVELDHGGNFATNGLYLELAGTYEVELHVYDSEGTRSCEPARLTVESVAGDGLHIQLVWDTPADPSRFNNSGADMDLHLRHQTGVWNVAPMNCYWLNMNPNWGNPNDDEMNPSLDIDKIDGWGPENINLRKPETGVSYSVGVDYFSDHGYGASYATVRIFIDGELHLEMNRRRMTNKQFWHVADVAWPSGSITIFDSVTQGFPN